MLRGMISKEYFLAKTDNVFLQYGVICNEKVVSKSFRENNALFVFE